MIYDISHKLGKDGFDTALENTQHGDTIIYHVGEFAAGKHKHNALYAYEGGMVKLVQKKLGKFKFQYLALRTKKRFKK
jgi:hypothetical protein|tara:strand:+ start:92 stop:325 length:234 start_codon:yes stop_codon:yes gene_type:complete